MGVYVHLAVVTDRVSDAAWQEIYEKARRVAKQWAPRPLSLVWRHIGSVRVAQYSLDIETTEGLHIVGDAESLLTGESLVLPAQLDRPAVRSARGGRSVTSDGDVLVAVVRRSDSGIALRWSDLLGNKTQGLPYHVLIVALGLLVEHSLRGAAVVYGDISARDGEQARRGLAAILGEEIDLPVVVDPPRLRRRLADSLSADVLDETIRALGPPAPLFDAIAGDLLDLLRGTPDGRVRHELESVVLSCPDLGRLSAETRLLLRELIGAIHSSVTRLELREQVKSFGAAWTRESIARGTLKNHLRLTSMAWDAIEAAAPDELAFLLGAVCIDTTRLEIHQMVRAVLENRVLRRA
jgi:hypothetical protein